MNKKMGKLIIFGMVWILFLIGLVVGEMTASTPSYCCEKTTAGAFCINANLSSCAALPFRSTPSSCSQTSYCRQGTCYDSQEGICTENVPQLVCNAQSGTWVNKPIEEVEQCQLGCCIIADQAAFVSKVRCKRLSTYYGVSIIFRTDVGSEAACIATAQGQDQGACVYEEEFDKTCRFTTRAECNAPDGIVNVNGIDTAVTTTNSSDKRFYKDYLCSAEQLNTNCGRQVNTSCYQGKVYWYDSCGNKENVYSSDKSKSWNSGKVASDTVVASYAALNPGTDKNNGNCDYLQGTVCTKYTGITGRPAYGNYYCKKTECKDAPGFMGDYKKTANRKNGESWCVYDSNVGSGLDPAGSLHYRYICIDGDVQVESCDDYRQGYGICFQNEDIDNGAGGKFSTAACRVNRWQDCLAQDDYDECVDRDQRECIVSPVIAGINVATTSISSTTGNTNTGFSNPTSSLSPAENISGDVLLSDDDDEEMQDTTTNRPDFICLPNYPPGLRFWESGEAKSICNQVSAKCYVTYTRSLYGAMFGDWECDDNCECLEEGWAVAANSICRSVGDCGGYVNWYDLYGFTDEGYNWVVDGDEKEFTAGARKATTGGLATGHVIGVDLMKNL